MKKYFIYLLLLLFTAPYFSSCSDEWIDSNKLNLLTKADKEEPIVEDDIDVSLLKFGFNLNPKAETDELPNADEPLDIYFYAEGKDLTDGAEECPLLDYKEACYLHTGVFTEGTWLYVPAAWSENLDKCKMVRVKDNVWKITLSPSIRDWFGSGSTPIQQLGLIIRTADGEKKGINEDVFMDIEDNKYNGFVPAEPTIATMPSGLQHGINIIDNSTVTLVLYEKDKTGVRYYDYAYVMGDFNNWKRSNDENSQMFYDKGNGCWWITLSGLDANKEYAFQYYLGKKSAIEGEKDTEMRVADPYTEKILDAGSDSHIPESTYPSSQRIYPSKGAGIVSVFKIRKDNYAWAHDDFKIADKNNLMIYELLIRDFTETGDLNGAIKKLDYLQDLGITAIELMPVQEFDGNDSWGYNPAFFFALDKAYGTSEMYKRFIDECHRRGIAVLFDVVYNHATGNNTFARLYWDSENNKTAENNPWFNMDAPHPFSVFHDFNHESHLVREFVKRNLKYLLDEYHIDGFRFDLTKGFTQNPNGGDASGYDESRIAILRDYYNTIQSVDPNAVMICEHWGNWAEENVLALAGMQCWRKGSNTHEDGYYQSGMGWQERSSFTNLTESGGNSIHFGGWVGFIESHDEERIAFKAKEYGDEHIKGNLTTRMNQLAANAAFCFTVPGPKMIWQFGELGYDETLGSDDVKTSKKPVHWEYYDDPARRSLYNVYAKLLNLRKEHADLFGQNANFSWEVTADKWTGNTPRTIILKHNNKELIVVGNFGDASTTYTLPNNIKYNYISGESVTDNNITIESHNFFLGTSFEP